MYGDEVAALSLAMTNIVYVYTMSRTTKALLVIGCIIVGYAIMGVGWGVRLPNALGMFLFFGGALLVFCAGIYGLIKLIGVIRKSFK